MESVFVPSFASECMEFKANYSMQADAAHELWLLSMLLVNIIIIFLPPIMNILYAFKFHTCDRIEGIGQLLTKMHES